MISQDDFRALQQILLQKSGMALGSDKLYLIAGRLGPVAVKFGFRGVLELMSTLRLSPRGEIVNAVVEAMATHESLFFRDQTPFECLSSNFLASLVHANPARKDIRIWSAACSSGQEAYSLAMIVRESAHFFPGYRFEIMATDFVPAILDKARLAVYSQFEVDRGVSKERLARHFESVEGKWRLRAEIRSMVQFRLHNLLDSGAILGTFDIVFCRNVLIYFDALTKERVIGGVLKQINDGGYAVFGATDVGVAKRPELRALAGLPGGYAFASKSDAKVA